MSSNPIKIIQITDCHLGDSNGDKLLSMNPDESLQDVLSLIKTNHPESDLAVVTGDLANDPTLACYDRLNTILSKQLSPFIWLPGNHDKPEYMVQAAAAPNQRLRVVGNWLIVMLDSHVDGQIHGNLSEPELRFLKQSLEDNPDKHVMICMHHQPVPIGSQWMDNYIVRNAQDFWALVKPFDHVKVVLWGHVHQEFDEEYEGTRLLATPSTCIQFTPEQKDFAVEDSMPGYRWFELNDDGSFTTGVERVEYKDYGTDFHSHGY